MAFGTVSYFMWACLLQFSFVWSENLLMHFGQHAKYLSRVFFPLLKEAVSTVDDTLLCF